MAEFTYYQEIEDEETPMMDEPNEMNETHNYFQDEVDMVWEAEGEQEMNGFFQDGGRAVTTEEAIRQGKAVIDGGATRTMGSLHAIECLTNRNRQNGHDHGVHMINTEERPVFGFGNSQKSRCMSTCTMKIPCEAQPLNMKVHVLEQGQAPILLSVESLRRMGAIIDYANDLAVFRKLDAKVVVPLERSQAGHQLLPLSEDFLRGGKRVEQSVPSLREIVEE